MKTYHFQNRYVPILTAKSGANKDIYLYGYNNLLPNEMLRLINDSGCAKRAGNKLKRYIEADGFAEEKAAQFMVNDTQTADSILSIISSYCAYNNGFALAVERLAGGKLMIKSIPFECVRVRKDGHYTFNPLLGQEGFQEKDTTVHAAYFGTKPTREQLALITQPQINGKKNDLYGNAEILYVFDKSADNPNYPVPDFWAGVEDLKTSVELQGLDLESVRNGFMPSAILTTHKMDNSTKDEAGKTEMDYMEDNLKSFTGGKKNKAGESQRLALMWVQVQSMEQAPKLDAFDAKSIIESSINKRDQIERTVSRLMGVHPVLLGYSDAAVLGNTQAIANASKDLTDYVNPTQRMISRAFGLVFPEIDWTLTQFNFWTNIPTEVWGTLTEDEKRATIGYQPKEQEVTTEAENTIKAINSLSPLVANKALESMTPDEVRALVGLKSIQDADTKE